MIVDIFRKTKEMIVDISGFSLQKLQTKYTRNGDKCNLE